MEESIDKKSSMLDSVKWLVVMLLATSAVIGNSYYAEQPLLYRVLVITGLSLLSLWLAYTTTKGQLFGQMLKEARFEARKIVWPTRQETFQTTLGVIVLVLVVALFLWLLDTFLSWIISGLVG